MEKLWLETRNALEEKIDKNKFSVWLKPIKYKSYINGTLTLSVLNQASLSFIKQNFLSLIKNEASIKAGIKLDVVITIELNDNREYHFEKQSEIRKKPKKRFLISCLLLKILSQVRRINSPGLLLYKLVLILIQTTIPFLYMVVLVLAKHI